MAIILDLETVKQDDEVILKNTPEWNEEEARTRVPKHYKKDEAINGWLEEDRAGYRANLLEKAALNPETATVAILGTFSQNGVDQYVKNDDASEMEIVHMALGMMSHEVRSGGCVLGWNILGFDLPFLLRRAWILGIKVPKSIYNPLSRYPVSTEIVDMMDRWKGGNWKAPHTSLNNALKAVGLPGKPDGKEFASLWREDRKKAMAYNEAELKSQAELYRRMGVDL